MIVVKFFFDSQRGAHPHETMCPTYDIHCTTTHQIENFPSQNFDSQKNKGTIELSNKMAKLTNYKLNHFTSKKKQITTKYPYINFL